MRFSALFLLMITISLFLGCANPDSPQTTTTVALKYSVTYHASGATGSVPVAPQDYASGRSVTVAGSGTLVNSGYTFAGWTTSASAALGGASYASGATFTVGSAATNLYAVWIPNGLTFTSSGDIIQINGYSPTAPTGAFVIPTGVTTIGYSAFSGCTGITSIAIPNSVRIIGGVAFSGCTGINSTTIPSSVISIRADAFNGCSGLTDIAMESPIPPVLPTGSGAFSGAASNFKIHVPSSASIDAYYAAAGWSDYLGQIVFP